MKRALLPAALCASLALAYGCDDGLQSTATLSSIPLSVAFSFAGGSPEAYDKTNRIWVRLTSNDEVRFEQELPFAPAGETRVPLRVPLRNTNESFQLEFELRRDADAVFRGSSPLALTPDRAASVNLTLLPVIVRVSCSGPVVQMSSYGETVQLSASALFVTGDTARQAALNWSTPSGGAVTVSPAGLVTSVRDGTAQVTCASGSASDVRQVQVAAVVRSIVVTPSSATVTVGGTQTFTATMRDSRDNIISGRTPTWSVTPAGVATITQAGVASGVAPGRAQIDATSGGVTGSATLQVTGLVPTATTGAAGVVRVTATLQGTVNPNGSSTQAFFEWGTSSTLTGATTSPFQSIGSGNAVINVAETLYNLAPSTTYYFRVAATNSGGTVRGAIQSFRTVDPGLPIVTTLGGAFPAIPFARLDGLVIPMGPSTRYYFVYGMAQDSMFNQTSAMTAGTGFDPISVSQVIQWSGRLWVQLVAQNQYGTQAGNKVDMGFSPQIVTPPVNRRAGTPAQVQGKQHK